MTMKGIKLIGKSLSNNMKKLFAWTLEMLYFCSCQSETRILGIRIITKNKNTMKKISNLLLMAIVAMTTLTMVSCGSDDEYIAYSLEGTWRGRIVLSDDWSGLNYGYTTTDICFLRDPYRYSSGQGYWVDYYSRASWDYVANHIEWTVRGGVIEVHFIEDNTWLEIRNYSLDYDYFVGTIYDQGTWADFKLYHVASPNWGSYDYYGYDDYYDYWAKPTTFDGEDGKARGPLKIERPIRGTRK